MQSPDKQWVYVPFNNSETVIGVKEGVLNRSQLSLFKRGKPFTYNGSPSDFVILPYPKHTNQTKGN